MTFKNAKQILYRWMRNQYTDERLAMLLDHARSGQLQYTSCCCFIGIVTADHFPLRRGLSTDDGAIPHYFRAHEIRGAKRAELAFWRLAPNRQDDQRRRILIPMILAEIRRRRLERETTPASLNATPVGGNTKKQSPDRHNAHLGTTRE